MKKIFGICFFVLMTGCILTHSSLSLAYAALGLNLWYEKMVPVLLPFMILSGTLIRMGMTDSLIRPVRPLFGRIFRLPGPGIYVILVGFLCGFPMGARTIADLRNRQELSSEEGQYLLAFCNNSGPAFILGVVGTGIFASSRAGLLLYLAHIAASLCVGLLFRFYRPGEGPRPGRHAAPQFQAASFPVAFTHSITGALSSTLNICAFVLFFTVVIRMLFLSGVMGALAGGAAALLSPLGLDQAWAQRLITGLLELSSGVSSLTGAGTVTGRLSMAAFMLGWAGLSVHCQVLAFLGDSGLSLRTYLTGKLLHGGLSALFTALLVRRFPLEAPVSSYLAEQVEGIASLDFQRALTISTAAAWGVWLLFVALAVYMVKKSSGKPRPKRV